MVGDGLRGSAFGRKVGRAEVIDCSLDGPTVDSYGNVVEIAGDHIVGSKDIVGGMESGASCKSADGAFERDSDCDGFCED